MTEDIFKFWNEQFSSVEERQLLAVMDAEVKRMFTTLSPRERVVSGDELIAFQKRVSEKFGLSPDEADKVLERLWQERDTKDGYANG